MGVEMAVKNHVSDGSRQAARAVENIQSVTFLRAERDGVQDRGNRILGFQLPLMVVEMEDMGLLDSSVDEPDFEGSPT